MRTAFKEWAVVVDALGCGDQIIILRKGGISEGRGGFTVEHPEFVLFPTLFHQQREAVLPKAQTRFDQIVSQWPDASHVRLELFARVVEWRRLESFAHAERLQGQHVWRDEVIAERFAWGREKAIHALALRVWRLPRPVVLPALPSYGGCKSWIELAEEIDSAGAVPVTDDAAFERKLAAFREALDAGAATFADSPVSRASSVGLLHRGGAEKMKETKNSASPRLKNIVRAAVL